MFKNKTDKRQRGNERLKLICLAIESLFARHGESKVRLRNNKMYFPFHECSCRVPFGQTVSCHCTASMSWVFDDDATEWWCAFEINNDERFPQSLRAVNKFYDYGKILDSEVGEAAERMAAVGLLNIERCSVSNMIYFSRKC